MRRLGLMTGLLAAGAIAVMGGRPGCPLLIRSIDVRPAQPTPNDAKQNAVATVEERAARPTRKERRGSSPFGYRYRKDGKARRPGERAHRRWRKLRSAGRR